MSANEKYDLKKSGKRIQLYPVLKDKKGNVIDGKHRLEAEPNWKTETVEGIDTEEDFLIARCVANWNRRRVTAEEKIKWINDLAELYKKQSYKVLITGNEIVKKIVEATGLSMPTIYKYLDDKYKVYSQNNRKRKATIPASERIIRKLGKEVQKRHTEEVKKELMSDTEFIEAITQNNSSEAITNKKSIQPDFSEMFLSKNQSFVEIICKPLKRFNRIKIDVKEIDAEQKKQILTTILETEKKLIEWKEALG